MNKKLLLILVATILLACNALLPQTLTATPQPTAVPGTESTPTASEPPATTLSRFETVRLHPRDGELHALLTQEAQKATALGLMPVAEFDATWCPPCRAIEDALDAQNELMLKAYAGTYIIKMDVDEWSWTEEGVQDFKFEGIPIYFKLDAQGQPTGEVIDGNAWGDNIPENIAPPMDQFFHGNSD